ncbi:PHD finger protein 11 [Chaetodon trifascialis]|uniref:PHD finger protein 11 n=1 Tax=Chaetodon trifascialis TaxID=109706 RepID=UPI00399699CC
MEMSPRHEVSCMLCQQSRETEITGALSTKDQATAHQNCLLFSSGIICRDSPHHDDLFGFSVEDVMEEVKRGRKLTCSKCKKKGATAGCEHKRCKKSYHYPCALLDGAQTSENEEMGQYVLYCYKHSEQTNRNQKPPRLRLGPPQDAESESLLPPVESSKDFQSLPVTNVAHATQTVSTAYPSVITVKVEHEERDGEGSSPKQSPVHSPDQHIVGPSVPQESSEGPPPSPDHTTTRSVTSSPNSPAPPDETVCVPPSASPAALPADPEPSIHSTSFWKSCNAAGCTQAIFTDFINEMNVISSRIQSDQASQEDYDLALTVMEASGKLAEFVTKQQKELQRKQVELQKAAAAMEEVVSALRK